MWHRAQRHRAPVPERLTTRIRGVSHPERAEHTRNLVSGLLFGIGLAAFVDETVFHQLLHWHHFYDRSTLAVGLVSDGLFHAFGWFAVVVSLFVLADLRRRRGLWWLRWIGGVALGAGAFQLYDGTIQHKLHGSASDPLRRGSTALRPDLEPARGDHDHRRSRAHGPDPAARARPWVSTAGMPTSR